MNTRSRSCRILATATIFSTVSLAGIWSARKNPLSLLSVVETANSSVAVASIEEKSEQQQQPSKRKWNKSTTARKCDNNGTDFEDIARQYSKKFKSQRGEDKHLMKKWFHNLCSGTYIEMGALGGIMYSNSHVFNKTPLRWRGVLIEIMLAQYNKMVVHRPDEIATIHAGVCSQKQKLHSVEQLATGGIFEFAAPSFRKEWWGGNTLEEVRTSGKAHVTEIECDTLDNLLLENARNYTFFDFFSLDVEGAELEALRSVDFDRVGFGVIFVEADEHNQTKNIEVKSLLESKGYKFLEEIGGSYWFQNLQFSHIYEGLIP